MPKIKFSIITMLPTNNSLNVKKHKHHNTLKRPFAIIKIVVDNGILSFLIQKKLTMPKAEYITVHTIGITTFGIHWVGLLRLLNQSMPIFTKMLPSIATASMMPEEITIFIILFFCMLI